MKMWLRMLSAAMAVLALASAQADSSSLRALAQADDPVRWTFAASKGAVIEDTADDRSFTLWWAPPQGTPKGVIVALHGHGSFATDELYLWQPYAEKVGYAILALQWWFGGGESTSDYYAPEEMYPIISSRLAARGVRQGSVMFIGFSRGSANSYALAALDAAGPAARRWFGFVFSNSGGAALDYPPTKAVDSGRYGLRPYAGLPWGLYCGEKDDDPDKSGCPAMTFSRDWVARLGAEVVQFIDDPAGGHGGFMTNSAHVEAALATYAQVLAGPIGDAVGTLEADCLFDWGEDRYADVLQPRRSASLVSAPYYYRRYAGSNTALGISSADNRLYFLDVTGILVDLGLAATWSSQAGCR